MRATCACRAMFARRNNLKQNKRMADFANKSPSVSAPERLMEFEHPLTERIRTFLRIELLNQLACFHADDTTELGARAALTSLLEILNLFKRGDVRMEVIKELELQRQILASYIRLPNVDHDRLEGNLENIKELQARIGDSNAVMPNPLKESPFLFNINHRSSIPGGTCIFDLPDYGYWLKLPYEERGEQYRAWLDRFAPICDAVSHILWLIRQTSQPKEMTVDSRLVSNQPAERCTATPDSRIVAGGRWDLSGNQRRQTALYPEVCPLAGHRRTTRTGYVPGHVSTRAL